MGVTITRRQMLKQAALAAGALSLPACGLVRNTYRGPVLVKVKAEEERHIRSVAGLRPYRPSGFRVEPESLGEKTLIHNYGHGGSGITLSWGTARLALEHALSTPHRRAAIIGCGVVGLSTARLLQDHGFAVTIYARDLPPNTTSNIAGALWAPFSVASGATLETEFAATLAQAARFSHRYFQGLVGERYAVRWLPLYMLSNRPQAGVPSAWSITPELFKAVPLEPEQHPFPFRGARRAFVMMIEPDPYLRALMEDFRVAGGEIVLRDFPDKASVQVLNELLIVNCTGLGARDLFGDEELIPVRGQLEFLVPQPEIAYMYLSSGLYMFPRRNGILLGGTFEQGNWSTEPDPATTRRLLAGHRDLAERMR